MATPGVPARGEVGLVPSFPEWGMWQEGSLSGKVGTQAGGYGDFEVPVAQVRGA